MSALEDIELERTREKLGALVLLTQDSSPRPQHVFLEADVLNGVLDLIESNYAQRDEGEDGRKYYSLTNEGWN